MMSNGQDDVLLFQRFFAMNPPTITAQQHKVMVRNGKPVFYDPPKLKAVRAKLVDTLASCRPEKPYDFGVRLIVKWCFAANGRHEVNTYRITKPDTDNLEKLLKDCMTRCGYWVDDALVASEIVEKLWTEVPGIWIRISRL